MTKKNILIAILGAVGYVAHADLSQTVLMRMNVVINLGPALCFALAIIPFMMIRMSNKNGRENELKIKLMTENKQ